MEVLWRSDAVVLDGLLRALMETVAIETTIAATQSLLFSLLTVGSLPNMLDLLSKSSAAAGDFDMDALHAKEKPGPENKDASETEDDGDDEDAVAEDDDDDDEEYENEGGEEDDDDDDPAANGEGGSDDEDGEEDDDDDDDDGDDGEEEEEEEEEEETPQPPPKKRK